MKNQFIPYELALKLKELGFNEECFGVYINGNFEPRYRSKNSKFNPNSKLDKRDLEYCTAPLYQQVFDWLLWKLKDISIDVIYSTVGCELIVEKQKINKYDTKEKCLEKLIELVENEDS